MDKSIAIINTPKHCGECEMMYWGLMSGEPRCCLNHRTHDVAFELGDRVRPEWCPLIHIGESTVIDKEKNNG